MAHTLLLENLYKLIELTPESNKGLGNSLSPRLYIYGTGTVNIYGADEEPLSLADMNLAEQETGVDGLQIFGIVPEYIYITVNSGSINKIVVSDLDVINLGGF